MGKVLNEVEIREKEKRNETQYFKGVLLKRRIKQLNISQRVKLCQGFFKDENNVVEVESGG